MGLHQMPGDGQAEPCAFARGSPGISSLIELIENGGVFLLRNTDSRVADGDLQKIAFTGRFHPYAPALRCELHRVIQEVIEDLFYAQAVRVQSAPKAVPVFHFDVLRRGVLAYGCQHFFKAMAKIERLAP